jgi:hypothetical protein
VLSLHTGYDTSYLTDAVGSGAAASDYYAGAKGEPPGYGQGRGARAPAASRSPSQTGPRSAKLSARNASERPA